MTENKRFIVKEDSFTDKLTKKTYCELLDIIDLYNRLWKQTQRFEKYNRRLMKEYIELKKENQELRMSPRVDTNEIESLVCENEQLKSENMELKERNNRQYKQLNQLYHLIEEENWETLTMLNNELKENEKQLQREWECYSDGV